MSDKVGQDNNDKAYTYIMIISTCMIVLLLAGYIADNTRNSMEIIQDFNIDELEQCTYLQCRYTLTGNLQCKTLDVYNITVPSVHKNLSQWEFFN